MMSDASEMLAAALEQMDGIIAGSKAMDYSNGLFGCQSPTSPLMGGPRPLHLLEDLRAALDLMDNQERDNLRCQIPDSTAEGLAEWLQGRMTNGHSSEAVYQERLTRLESDKECLILQVSVLTDQVEVQGEKIRDLDNCLERHREKLCATEELLQKELLTCSALETQKLELMTEVSGLKLKLSAAERDHDVDSYREISQLRLPVADIESEHLQCDGKIKACKEELRSLQRELQEREAELRRLKDESRPRPTAGRDRDAEMSEMKTLLDSLVSANDEKEQRIKELESSQVLGKIKERPKEDDDDIVDDRSLPAVAEVRLKAEAETGRISAESHPSGSAAGEMKEADRERPLRESKRWLAVSPSNTNEQAKAKCQTLGGEDTLGAKRLRASFGRGLLKMRGGKRTSSTPNLAETERKVPEHFDSACSALPSPPESKKKSKGLMKFFGRLKRSHSASLNPDDEAQFQRGGVRATAGPRLCRSGAPADVADVPFLRWTREDVCQWLHEQGLGLYAAPARTWVQSGQSLLQASQHRLEKELGMKHPLHRKKLQLALQALRSPDDLLKGKLDHNWVTRWLDDVGLPQYKSHFDEARVDACMLHYMTVEDLLSLKVGSVLHHLSIKRAVQVLRLNSFRADCLRRRPADEKCTQPADVIQWSNHRVMEWLRSVDLAEYAPNLRGSGVHGGLMVLEPRFTVDALALLLNIPPGKTLLRRHLATHFHLLVGADARKLKQECLENPDYVVLTAAAKVKPRHLSFGGFGSLRKKRHDDGSEYVCPMDVGGGLCQDHLEQREQMGDSEGAVRQIGAFCEGIDNLTSMVEDEDVFGEVSAGPREGDQSH
ncbi:liprin-beta-1-like [Hippocampus zosterae]|uniref:liprin-beta-1-like n=1 Tax=Hippocampus zosterae TaxID=109293 RepID=UPI00223CAF50|nr:liprin-beta-1-like [Hippocampus zosterae]XP_051911882.1 liprin-beta-1-like [Hippocampus zosterae]XP_051911884.1 liprin-beta-1-like [Hippocampus zosterae]